MRDLFYSSAVALVLAGGIVGTSLAQDQQQSNPSAPQAEQKQAPAMPTDGAGTSPGARDAAKSVLENTPGLAGPNSSGGSEKGAAEQKDAAGSGTNAPVDNAQGGKGHPIPLQTIGPPNAGPLPVRGEGPQVPGATRQTAPAKFSEQNADLAEYSIMGYPVQLNDEQKQAIWQAVGGEQAKTTASAEGKTIFAEAGVFLPSNVDAQPLPEQLNAQIPQLRGLKYVKADDKLLLVAPSNGIVRGVIEE